MSRKPVYAEDIPDDVYTRMVKDSYDEESAFRMRMKGIEEHATSGAVTKPHATIAGQRVRIAHRMGDRFDVQVQDPFTKQMRSVVSHRYDLRGRRTGTDVAWTRGDPYSVAAVFGIPFVSVFGDLPKAKPQSVSDEEAIEKARHQVWLDAQIRNAREREEMRLDREAFFRVGNRKQEEVSPSDWERSQRHKKRRGGK